MELRCCNSNFVVAFVVFSDHWDPFCFCNFWAQLVDLCREIQSALTGKVHRIHMNSCHSAVQNHQMSHLNCQAKCQTFGWRNTGPSSLRLVNSPTNRCFTTFLFENLASEGCGWEHWCSCHPQITCCCRIHGGRMLVGRKDAREVFFWSSIHSQSSRCIIQVPLLASCRKVGDDDDDDDDN